MFTPSTALRSPQVCDGYVWVYYFALRNTGRSNPTPELRTAHHWMDRHCLLRGPAGRHLEDDAHSSGFIPKH